MQAIAVNAANERLPTTTVTIVVYCREMLGVVYFTDWNYTGVRKVVDWVSRRNGKFVFRNIRIEANLSNKFELSSTTWIYQTNFTSLLIVIMTSAGLTWCLATQQNSYVNLTPENQSPCRRTRLDLNELDLHTILHTLYRYSYQSCEHPAKAVLVHHLP